MGEMTENEKESELMEDIFRKEPEVSAAGSGLLTDDTEDSSEVIPGRHAAEPEIIRQDKSRDGSPEGDEDLTEDDSDYEDDLTDEPGDSPEDGEDSSEETEDDEELTEEERKKNLRKELIGDVVFILVSIVVLLIVFKLFPPYRVSGDSMNQTIKDKAFGFGTIFFTPEYGDIVVLHGDADKTNGSDFIKRIVGKPGDVLEITDGVIVRNGEKIDEPYAYYDPEVVSYGDLTQRIELKEGEYLVMGDNRYHSMDGRYFGPISRSEMKCKMLFFLWGKKR